MTRRADVSRGALEALEQRADMGMSDAAGQGLRVFLAALNHLLAADPAARSMLLPHVGRIIRIELRREGSQLLAAVLRVGRDGLLESVGGSGDGPPAVTMVLRASVDAGFAVVRGGAAGLQPHLRIEGDVLLAAALGELSRSLRWDVEEDLSRVTGDVVAHRLVAAATDALAGLRALGERFGVSFARRWSVEDPVLVTRSELKGHSNSLSSLESRLASLERRMGARR